ncbi:MAG: hypothetical protein Q9226_009009, partial [Calogaya cf. arnoldii]
MTLANTVLSTMTKSQDEVDAALEAKLIQSSEFRKCNDTISITGSCGRRLRISFQRTVRVPDNQGENKLPPSLGTFPLYSVSNFPETMPADMATKGGLFLPMY